METIITIVGSVVTLFSFVSMLGTLISLRGIRARWEIITTTGSELSGTVVVPDGEPVRAFVKVKAAGIFVREMGKPMPNTRDEQMSGGVSILSLRREVRIKFFLP
jgi:hypothetical protein